MFFILDSEPIVGETGFKPSTINKDYQGEQIIAAKNLEVWQVFSKCLKPQWKLITDELIN